MKKPSLIFLRVTLMFCSFLNPYPQALGSETAAAQPSTAPILASDATLREEVLTKTWDSEKQVEEGVPQEFQFWNWKAYGEHYFSASEDKDIQLSGLNLEIERRFEGEWERFFSLAAAAGVHYAHGDSQYLFEPEATSTETAGFSLSLIGRVYVWEWERVGFYIEGSPGVAVFTEGFPRNGTNTNFIGRYGAGVKVAVNDSVEIVAGYRRLFIGNGKGLSEDNPTYDGNGFIAGAKVKF